MTTKRLRAVPRTSPEVLPYHAAKRRVMDAFTCSYVEEVWRVSGGNMSEAARLADMDRTNFRHIVQAARRLWATGRVARPNEASESPPRLVGRRGAR